MNQREATALMRGVTIEVEEDWSEQERGYKGRWRNFSHKGKPGEGSMRTLVVRVTENGVTYVFKGLLPGVLTSDSEWRLEEVEINGIRFGLKQWPYDCGAQAALEARINFDAILRRVRAFLRGSGHVLEAMPRTRPLAK